MSFEAKKLWVRILCTVGRKHESKSVESETIEDLRNSLHPWFNPGRKAKGQLAVLTLFGIFMIELGLGAQKLFQPSQETALQSSMEKIADTPIMQQKPERSQQKLGQQTFSPPIKADTKEKRTPKELTKVTKRQNLKKNPAPKKRMQPAYVLSEHEVAGILRIVGISKNQAERLTCTARFESSFNPRAKNINKNGTQDTGLFQINDIWLADCGVSRKDLTDPLVNAKCAKKILQEQGFGAWMAYTERKKLCNAYEVGDFGTTPIAKLEQKPTKKKL